MTRDLHTQVLRATHDVASCKVCVHVINMDNVDCILYVKKRSIKKLLSFSVSTPWYTSLLVYSF